jgi:putative Ca2+/H+ antiporter (TMEM165/GDT1 family)
MSKLFYALFTLLLSSSFKRVLLGAGITMISSTAMNALINSYISDMITTMNGTLSTALSFLALGGFDKFFSVMIGAFIAKASISSFKLGFSKSN